MTISIRLLAMVLFQLQRLLLALKQSSKAVAQASRLARLLGTFVFRFRRRIFVSIQSDERFLSDIYGTA